MTEHARTPIVDLQCCVNFRCTAKCQAIFNNQLTKIPEWPTVGSPAGWLWHTLDPSFPTLLVEVSQVVNLSMPPSPPTL